MACYISLCLVREELKEFTKDFDHSEEDLKSLQSGVGQIVGEVLRQLTEEKCKNKLKRIHFTTNDNIF